MNVKVRKQKKRRVANGRAARRRGRRAGCRASDRDGARAAASAAGCAPERSLDTAHTCMQHTIIEHNELRDVNSFPSSDQSRRGLARVRGNKGRCIVWNKPGTHLSYWKR